MIGGKWMLALGAVLLASAAVVMAPLSSARAARAERATLTAAALLGDDHLDAPGVRNDPAADTTMMRNPAPPVRLVRLAVVVAGTLGLAGFTGLAALGLGVGCASSDGSASAAVTPDAATAVPDASSPTRPP